MMLYENEGILQDCSPLPTGGGEGKFQFPLHICILPVADPGVNGTMSNTSVEVAFTGMLPTWQYTPKVHEFMSYYMRN